MLACRSDECTTPEVVVLSGEGARKVWAAGDIHPAPELSVVEGAWAGAGSQEIHGILLVPSANLAASGNGGSLVVIIHGGPILAYHHAFDPARAYRLVGEGFSVLLPHPRGSVGRGGTFARATSSTLEGPSWTMSWRALRWLSASCRLAVGAPGPRRHAAFRTRPWFRWYLPAQIRQRQPAGLCQLCSTAAAKSDSSRPVVCGSSIIGVWPTPASSSTRAPGTTP